MIDRSLMKEHLALDRRTITELATAISAIAVIGATLYNLGFFAPIEWSLISLLTVQDMLVGAVIAAAPMTVAAWVAFLIGRLIRFAPERRLLTLALGVPAFAVAGIGFGVFLSGPLQWTFGHLASGYLLLGMLATGSNIVLRSKRLPLIWLVFSLLYIPTSVGISDSLAASGPQRPISEVETDRTVMRGSVIRITSAYLLFERHNTIVTMPMIKVREVRRLYAHSPETDFLNGGESTDR